MAKFNFFRIQAEFQYNPVMINRPATDPRLAPFTRVMWHGLDDEGYCVYKQNPVTGEVVRIDFRN